MKEKTWFIKNVRCTELDNITNEYMDEFNVPKKIKLYVSKCVQMILLWEPI